MCVCRTQMQLYYLEYVEGLVLVHVECGRADAALLERGREALVVDEPAARSVHQKRT